MLLWKHIKRLVVGGVQHSINHPRRDDQVQVQSAMAVRLACDYTTTSTITAVSMIVKDPLVAGTLCTCSIRKMVSLLLGGVWGCAVANTSCEGGPTYTSPNIRLHVTLLYRCATAFRGSAFSEWPFGVFGISKVTLIAPMHGIKGHGALR